MPHPKPTIYIVSKEHGVYAIANTPTANAMYKMYPNDEFIKLFLPYEATPQEQIALIGKALKDPVLLNKITPMPPVLGGIL